MCRLPKKERKKGRKDERKKERMKERKEGGCVIDAFK